MLTPLVPLLPRCATVQFRRRGGRRLFDRSLAALPWLVFPSCRRADLAQLLAHHRLLLPCQLLGADRHIEDVDGAIRLRIDQHYFDVASTGGNRRRQIVEQTGTILGDDFDESGRGRSEEHTSELQSPMYL